MLELLQHESSKNILPWYWTFILPVSSCLVIWILLKILLSHPVLSALYPFRRKMGLNKDLHILYNNMNAQEVYQSVSKCHQPGPRWLLHDGELSPMWQLQSPSWAAVADSAEKGCWQSLLWRAAHAEMCLKSRCRQVLKSRGCRQWHPAEVEEGWW